MSLQSSTKRLLVFVSFVFILNLDNFSNPYAYPSNVYESTKGSAPVSSNRSRQLMFEVRKAASETQPQHAPTFQINVDLVKLKLLEISILKMTQLPGPIQSNLERKLRQQAIESARKAQNEDDDQIAHEKQKEVIEVQKRATALSNQINHLVVPINGLLSSVLNVLSSLQSQPVIHVEPLPFQVLLVSNPQLQANTQVDLGKLLAIQTAIIQLSNAKIEGYPMDNPLADPLSKMFERMSSVMSQLKKMVKKSPQDESVTLLDNDNPSGDGSDNKNRLEIDGMKENRDMAENDQVFDDADESLKDKYEPKEKSVKDKSSGNKPGSTESETPLRKATTKPNQNNFATAKSAGKEPGTTKTGAVLGESPVTRGAVTEPPTTKAPVTIEVTRPVIIEVTPTLKTTESPPITVVVTKPNFIQVTKSEQTTTPKITTMTQPTPIIIEKVVTRIVEAPRTDNPVPSTDKNEDKDKNNKPVVIHNTVNNNYYSNPNPVTSPPEIIQAPEPNPIDMDRVERFRAKIRKLSAMKRQSESSGGKPLDHVLNNLGNLLSSLLGGLVGVSSSVGQMEDNEQEVFRAIDDDIVKMSQIRGPGDQQLVTPLKGLLDSLGPLLNGVLGILGPGLGGLGRR